MKYTYADSELLKSQYLAGTSIEDLATAFETTPRSIIAKLSSMHVYKAKEYVDKQGNPPRKKEDMLDELADLLGVPPERLDSLEKATKSVLTLLIENLK